MKRRIVLIVVCCLALIGCGKVTSDEETNKTQETEQMETTKEDVTELPADFKEVTDEEAARIPDRESLLDVGEQVLGSIGVRTVKTGVWGNYTDYSNGENSNIAVDFYGVADSDRMLKVTMQYFTSSTSAEWSVNSVCDVDNGNYYYVPDEWKTTVDLYDYKTQKLISEKSESKEEVQERITPKAEEESDKEKEVKKSYSEENRKENKKEKKKDKSADSRQTMSVSKLKVNDELITDITEKDMPEWYDYIVDVSINVDEGEKVIYIAVQVPTAINEDTAKMAGEDVARYLASQACNANKDFKAPGSDDIGGIYDRYDLLIYVDDGIGNINLYGAKVISADRITW